MSLRARLTLAYSAVLAGGLPGSAEEILRTSRVTTQRELRILTLPSLQFASSNVYVQVWNAEGTLIASSSNMGAFEQPLDALSLQEPTQQFRDVRVGEVHLRVLTVPVVLASEPSGFLQLAAPMAVGDRARGSLLIFLAGGGG